MKVIINNKTIFDSFEEEREEKMKSLCSDSIYSENIFLKNLNIYNRLEAEITGALNYAKGLNFSKNPLKSSYLSHPLRLASFLLQFEPTIPTNYIIIALLHNVPETTDISINEIKQRFGVEVADGIETLLVDRSVPFSAIQDKYYEELFSKGNWLILIKLLDKIDNLLVLGLNPDDEVRKNYIQEVREKLLPFTLEYNNQLGLYLDGLLTSTLKLGYLNELKQRLINYQQSL